MLGKSLVVLGFMILGGAIGSEYCTFNRINGTFWMSCPGAGLLENTLSLGVNHVENADTFGLSCPDGSFGPQRTSKELGTFCSWWALTYSAQLNASAYLNSTLDRYGSTSNWSKVAVDRLLSWNFNTLGSWSSPLLTSPGALPSGMVYGYSVDMLMTSYEHRMLPSMGMPMDVFSSEFATKVTEIADKECAPRKEDVHLLGYWWDNETPWVPSGDKFNSMLTGCLVTFDASSEGFQATIAWLQSKYSSIASLNTAWNIHATSWSDLPSQAPFPSTPARAADDESFLEFYVETYANVSAAAIRKADPNHMILGSRMLPNVPDAVVRGQAPYTDVVDLHFYENFADQAAINHFHNISNHPILISEYGFRSLDSGLPNTKGAGPIVWTQSARAAKFDAYIRAAVANPNVVGLHMFAWNDMSSAIGAHETHQSNGFGADSSYGLVNNADDPYSVTTALFQTLNPQIPQLHS